MNEQAQFRSVLNAARSYLPEAVVATCESLNDHGEWEMALSHCQFYLAAEAARVPDSVRDIVAACEKRFRS